MRIVLAILFVGAAGAAPACFCRRPSCEAHVSVELENGTLRDVFREVEWQAGYPVATGCSCGALQAIIDQRGFTFKVRGISAGQMIRLATMSRMDHCGGWLIERDRAVLRCGRGGRK